MIYLRAIFKGLCPNCGNEIDDERLQLKIPCSSCLPVSIDELSKMKRKLDEITFLESIADRLQETGKLKNYRKLVELERKIEELNVFFKKILGNDMWSAQRTWAKRIFQNKSFSILAPTGVGKTVFAIIISLYLAAKEGKKAYLVLPTTLLVKQVYEKTVNFAERAGIKSLSIVAYYTGLKPSEKKSVLENIKNRKFDILITTSSFLLRRFEYLSGTKFDLIVVDDVDAILKSSKSIDKVLILLGFKQEVIECASRLIVLKRRIAINLRLKKSIPEDLSEEFNNLNKKVSDYLTRYSNEIGCLVVSTATGRPRGLRVKLFRELLGFEIGSRSEFLRNISDLYVLVDDDLLNKLLEVVNKLGRGGLVFVPVSKGVEYAQLIADFLNEHGIRAAVVHAKEKKAINDFIEGKIDVLVGMAIYYGLLVRGLDLPHIIRYAVFVGVPHFRFSLDVEEALPSRLLQVSLNIRDCVDPEEREKLDRITSKLRTIFNDLSYGEVILLNEAIRTGKPLSGKLKYALNLVLQLREMLKNLLSRKSVRERLASMPMISLKEVEGKLYIYIPDAMTYLQASGRTSRLFAGGLSKGLSVVLVDDEKLFSGLMKQTKWYSDEVEWHRFDEVDIDSLIKEVDRDREQIRLIMAGKLQVEVKDLVKTALVIVESPSKAKTIASFFGKPSRRKIGKQVVYEVSCGDYILDITASKGHVFDLVTNEGYYGVLVKNGVFIPLYTTIKRCRKCGAQFTDQDKCPTCKSTEYTDQIDVLVSLMELASEADYVFLATDPDTEGEKIAWDLSVALSPYTHKIYRIEFHEVTRKAFLNAIGNLKSINMRYVDAQLVRRIEDRWIGFVLSRKLWDHFGKKWLSAGRVQTPVLGWIINRYEESKKSRKTVFIVKVLDSITFVFDNISLNGRKPREVADEIKESKLRVVDVEYEEEEVAPPPPFSTDTMLREAARLLKIGVDDIMRLAQDLFELGLITYHRTDSIRVSGAGQRVAASYIEEVFGKELLVPREWSSEGAHECIRPTRPVDSEKLRNLLGQGILVVTKPLTRYHFMLYDLIFRRFIASQMAKAKVLRQTLKVEVLNSRKEYSGYIEILDPGFTLIYKPFGLMKRLETGEYDVTDVEYKRVVSIPLYSQADIIQLMKEREIGRPSTYAKIVRTLFDRHYILSSKRGKLIPTKLGIMVYDFLEKNYREFISEERTRIVEKTMDEIAEGKTDYRRALIEFYEEIRRIDERTIGG